MKKLNLLILILVAFCSCEQMGVINETYYSYNDIVIKRVDTRTNKPGLSRRVALYYMKDGQPIDSVWNEFHGGDYWFRAGLIFEDPKVIIVGGGFRQNKKPNNFFTISTNYNENYNHKYHLYMDSLENAGQSYDIQAYGNKSEIKINGRAKTPSKVKAKYLMSDN